jgi:hypothetical protein
MRIEKVYLYTGEPDMIYQIRPGVREYPDQLGFSLISAGKSAWGGFKSIFGGGPENPYGVTNQELEDALAGKAANRFRFIAVSRFFQDHPEELRGGTAGDLYHKLYGRRFAVIEPGFAPDDWFTFDPDDLRLSAFGAHPGFTSEQRQRLVKGKWAHYNPAWYRGDVRIKPFPTNTVGGVPEPTESITRTDAIGIPGFKPATAGAGGIGVGTAVAGVAALGLLMSQGKKKRGR